MYGLLLGVDSISEFCLFLYAQFTARSGRYIRILDVCMFNVRAKERNGKTMKRNVEDDEKISSISYIWIFVVPFEA